MKRIAVFGLLAGAFIRPALANDDVIIVTGEKRAAAVAATESSVSVLRPGELRDRAVRDVRDLYAQTANLSPVFGGSGFSVRGIANIGVSGAGDAQTATIYVDGVPLAATYLQGAPTRLWDAAQVEIYRGPQSTLQGLNAIAGAVVVRTADPSLTDWEAIGQVTASAGSRWTAALAAGGPLVKDELGIRFAAERQHSRGFIHNITRFAREDDSRSASLRFKALWRPAAVPGLDIRLGVTHFDRDGGFYRVYARTDTALPFSHPFATDNIPNTTRVRFDSVVGEIRYELSPAVVVTSATSWSKVTERSQFDGDFGPANAAYTVQRRDYRTFTQELRLNVERDNLSGLLGLFYYDRNLASATMSRTENPTPVPTIASLLAANGFGVGAANALAGAYGAALPVIPVDFAGAFPTRVRTLALFGDARLKLTDRLTLLTGFRLDRETNLSPVYQTASFAGTYPAPASFGIFAPAVVQINAAVGGFVAQANARVAAPRRTFFTILPKAGLRVQWADNLSTALVVQKGYRSGGTSVNVARGQAAPYNAEYSWNWEFALRSAWLDDRLRLNTNGFYTDWHRQQLSLNFGLGQFDTATVNAGRSHLYGFEVEANYRVSPVWTVFSSVGHVRTRIDKLTVSTGAGVSDLRGAEFAFAPRWTATAGTTVRFASGWGAAASVSRSSRTFGAVAANQQSYRLSPYTLVNARVGFEGTRWSAHLVGSNLTDTHHIQYKNPRETRAVLNEGRRISIELAAKF